MYKVISLFLLYIGLAAYPPFGRARQLDKGAPPPYDPPGWPLANILGGPPLINPWFGLQPQVILLIPHVILPLTAEKTCPPGRFYS